jgi:hypothetical protein
MNRELKKIPGVIWNFSQPIAAGFAGKARAEQIAI